jgi:predicted ATPase
VAPYAVDVGLIGRESELATVCERLGHRRAVTLVGPGGIGKTSLALEVLARCERDYDDGSRVVDLTRIDTPAAVRESVAGQLGYASFRALLDAPADRSTLILVDNCEHVLDAAAGAIGELLDACRMPTVLVTSRAPLELPGEAVVPLGPLQLPTAGTAEGPAVRLFLDRALDAGVALVPSESVAELCRRLDGVPLAIELAAARTRSMTPDEILQRLSASLDVLARPRRRSARRHRSLRAAIDWSFRLLDPDEQALFARLSSFSGPFTAELAHAVGGAPGTDPETTRDLLDGLVGASMLVAEATGPTTWYRLLETIRAAGLEHLEARGERHAVDARFVDLVSEQAVGIIERGAATWDASALSDLLGLYENMAAAVRWCIANDDEPDRALLLVAVLWGVIHQAHMEEVGQLAEQVLDRWPGTPHPMRADAVATAATCRYMLGDLHGAVAMAEDALATASASPFAPATLRRAIAQATRAAGDAEAALEWFTETGAEATRLDLTAMADEAASAQAQILADLGQQDEALRRIAAVRASAIAAGSEIGAAWARAIEGSILLRSDLDAATAVLEAAVDEARRLGYDAAESVALRALALAALCGGDTRTAATRTLELLDGLLARGSTYEIRLVLDVAAPIMARHDHRRASADLAATALAQPVVSITASVGHELVPLDPSGGAPLSVRDAIQLVRTELARLLQEARPDPPGERSEAHQGVFRRVGELWEVGYGGGVATVRATKGMDDLSVLLGSPGREVHCLDLVGGGLAQQGTGEALDAAARRAYEDRVRDLQQEIDHADAANDWARADRARIEMDAVVDQLTAALGLGGRSRTTDSSAERARSAVTQRIRSTIKRIDAVDPRLGRHLRASIRTGTYCSYAPEEPVSWQR